MDFHKKKAFICRKVCIYFIVFSFFAIVLTDCSKKNKDIGEVSSVEADGIQSQDAKSVTENFLKKYSEAYNSKNIDSITSLYSSAPAGSLETKDGLKEFFLSSDSVTITFSAIKITVYDIKKLEFNSDVDMRITLNDKIINDKRKINYRLINEDNTFKLADKKILKKL